MARSKKKTIDLNNLTKREASRINRQNRNISGNINSLMDELSSITYGLQRNDSSDALTNQFNNLLKTELDGLNRASEGDTTSFLTKLFSENNKRIASSVTDLEKIFNTDEGQLQAFITEQYKNRILKQSDLHDVASQLVELQEAITITRDAIISADIIDGHMNRNLTFDDIDDKEDYISIVKQTEEKFELQEKIKNFIIPNSLEFGEYNIYCIPYSKIFEDFAKEKDDKSHNYIAYGESVETNLKDFVSKSKKNDLSKIVTESVVRSTSLSSNTDNINTLKKDAIKDLDTVLENITVCNTPVPLCILEEGVDSYREYYTEFVEKVMTETDKTDKTVSFDKIMANVDSDVGIHMITGNKSTKKSKDKNFSNIKDCYLKLIDPMHLLPITIMDEVIGFYYIQDEDITPLSGMLTSTLYYDNFGTNRSETNLLDNIADTIVSAFDRPFLEKNMKFKKLIVEALNYYKLNNKKIKFQFIPKEYIIQFKVNKDEKGNGVSIIENSLFYAKLYLMILLFKIMSILTNSNDTKVNYIKQSGIDKNVANKIQEIARKKQQRQITLMDVFSYTTLLNKIGQGSEMYIPVGKSGERGIETEILSGQDIQINNELMEMLKKAYISGTGVPDVLMNYIHEAEFAKTLELANNRFHGRVVSYQLDYNRQITELYKNILRYSTNIPENVIEAFNFSFIQPKYHNSNITNELLGTHTGLQDFLVILFFGQEGLDDPENVPKIQMFKKDLAKNRLPMLNFAELEDMYRNACINGTKEILDPLNNVNNNNDEGNDQQQ